MFRLRQQQQQQQQQQTSISFSRQPPEVRNLFRNKNPYFKRSNQGDNGTDNIINWFDHKKPAPEFNLDFISKIVKQSLYFEGFLAPRNVVLTSRKYNENMFWADFTDTSSNPPKTNQLLFSLIPETRSLTITVSHKVLDKSDPPGKRLLVETKGAIRAVLAASTTNNYIVQIRQICCEEAKLKDILEGSPRKGPDKSKSWSAESVGNKTESFIKVTKYSVKYPDDKAVEDAEKYIREHVNSSRLEQWSNSRDRKNKVPTFIDNGSHLDEWDINVFNQYLASVRNKEPCFKYKDDVVDHSKEVVYMLDVDIMQDFKEAHDHFVKNCLLPELLPHGSWDVGDLVREVLCWFLPFCSEPKFSL